MVTLGVDLAADPKRTGVCWIRWEDGRAYAYKAAASATDDELLAAFEEADKVGIDVPFGWPIAFVEAVAAHHHGEPWPDVSKLELRYRATDLYVHEKTGLWPLSVSSDRIAVPTFRMAKLMATLAERGEPVARDGSGKLVEVYPAAALKVWGFNPKGYKRSKGTDVRRQLMDDIEARTASWLQLDVDVAEMCRGSDDVLDAMVAGLVARATVTSNRTDTAKAIAGIEGWVAIPELATLNRIA